MEGFDYAWGYSASLPAKLKATGASFVVRYLGTSSKCVTLSEVYALQHEGIAVAMVYETTGLTFKGGRDAGSRDGIAARAAAVKILAPVGATIYFAIDTDTADYATVGQYLAGAQEALGNQYVARLYAGYSVIENSVGDGHWQTYAWSGGRISTKAGLYQYHNGYTVAGVSTDRDRVLANGPVNRGGWLVHSDSPNLPVPTPKPSPVLHPVQAARSYYRLKGNTNSRAAAGLKFAKAQNASGASSWRNLCAALVRTGYGFGTGAWGAVAHTAAGAWQMVVKKDRHGWFEAPAGVPCYWTGGSSGAGHVAFSDGLGNVWSNDFGPHGYIGDGRVRLVPQGAISAHDGALKYVGWGETYLGYRVYN